MAPPPLFFNLIIAIFTSVGVTSLNLNASCPFGSFLIKLSKVMSPCSEEFEDSAAFWIRFAVEQKCSLRSFAISCGSVISFPLSLIELKVVVLDFFPRPC